MDKIILSLCDYSGAWPQPYADADYTVIQVDLKHGGDVRLFEYIDKPIYGILCAPPCTAFAGSGAQYWKKKDESGETLNALALVDACLRAVAIYNPKFWALENPVGRLKRWIGPPRLIFNPCDYGGYMAKGEKSTELAPPQDAYTKRTLLWGNFNIPVRKSVQPEFIIAPNGDKYSSIHWNTGGKSEKTKTIRSMTPKGFAQAFFESNP